jgi:pimeloyl-ACP methyl ester carboxylesterase
MTRRIACFLALALMGLMTAHAVSDETGNTNIKDEFFDSAGVKIHYVVSGEGEPVILIHGFTANIDAQWRMPGVFSKLSKDYQVIALDNRGHGKSDKPHDPKKYGPEMTADILRLMDHLKLAKAHLVGYSMGGFMTNYLVTHYPERVLTATLGGAGWRRPNDNRLDVLNQLAESLDAGKGITPLIEVLTPPGKPKPSDEQLAAINQMVLLMNDPKALAACIRGLEGVSVTESELKANKVPVLALIGGDDPLKLGVDEMSGVMPNLKIQIIDGADHMNAFSRPEFIDGLRAFLTAHSKAVAATGSAK